MTNNNLEERRFTLRLTEHESKCIEELKSVVRETTDSAVVRHVIRDYKKLYDSLKEEERKNKILKRDQDNTNEDLQTLFAVLERLNPNNK